MERNLLIGYYGWNNTGDDIMLHSLIELISRSDPDQEYTILSQRPSLHVPTKMKITYVNPANRIGFAKELVSSSRVILGGGTHLYDYGRVGNRVMRLLQLLLIFSVARSLSKKVMFIGIGVEPPERTWGKLIIRAICNTAHCISVRDKESYKTLTTMGVRAKVIQGFDLSAIIDFPNDELVRHNEGKMLGISVLPYYGIYYRDSESDNKLLANFSQAFNLWLDANDHNRVRLIVFKADSKDDDGDFTESLFRLLHHHDRVEVVPYDHDPMTTLKRIQECDAFIGMRYHSCVLAYITKRPLLVVSYARKNNALATDIGLDPRGLIEIDAVRDRGLEQEIKGLMETPSEYLAKLPREVAREMALASTICFNGRRS
jgi:polysaccharide pyruvyl transferase WcaK-like protein